GAFGQVIDGDDHDHTAGRFVDGQLHDHVVRPQNRFGGWPLAFREQVHELLILVGIFPGSADFWNGHTWFEFCGGRSQNTAWHWCQGWREGQADLFTSCQDKPWMISGVWRC